MGEEDNYTPQQAQWFSELIRPLSKKYDQQIWYRIIKMVQELEGTRQDRILVPQNKAAVRQGITPSQTNKGMFAAGKSVLIPKDGS